MKILFMGGRPIGSRCLPELAKLDHEIIVVPNLDDNNEDTWYPSTSKIAQTIGKQVWKVSFKNEKDIQSIMDFRFDILLSIGNTRIVPNKLLRSFSLGGINIHCAPLPRYRGWWPIMRAIANGEKVHASTMHYMAEEVDSGDIICQKYFPLYENDTGLTAYQRGDDTSFEMFCEMLPKILRNETTRIPQDISKATYYPRRLPNDGIVDLTKSETEIYNFVRALTFPPFPGPKIRVGKYLYEIKSVEQLKGI